MNAVFCCYVSCGSTVRYHTASACHEWLAEWCWYVCLSWELQHCVDWYAVYCWMNCCVASFCSLCHLIVCWEWTVWWMTCWINWLWNFISAFMSQWHTNSWVINLVVATKCEILSHCHILSHYTCTLDAAKNEGLPICVKVREILIKIFLSGAEWQCWVFMITVLIVGHVTPSCVRQ